MGPKESYMKYLALNMGKYDIMVLKTQMSVIKRYLETLYMCFR